MQTNGTLINNDWVDIFEEYKIGVGISIDGPKEFHDVYRVDHEGKGTYDKINKSMELLKRRN